MRVPRKSSRLYGVYFGSAALFDLRYGAEVEIDAGDIASYYLVRATLAGSGMVELGRRSAAIRAGSLTVSSPSERSLIRVGSDCRSLILRVERPALERRLQQLLERPLRTPLVFDVDVAEGSSGMAAVRQTLDYLCRLHQDPTSTGWRGAGGGLPDYLMSLLLMQLRNFSDALRADRRQPLPLRQARARHRKPSGRSRHPGGAGRALRRVHAHPAERLRALPGPEPHRLHPRPAAGACTRRWNRPGDNVTDILLRHGVTSFGHFASHYRKRYGCRPSDTLRCR